MKGRLDLTALSPQSLPRLRTGGSVTLTILACVSGARIPIITIQRYIRAGIVQRIAHIKGTSIFIITVSAGQTAIGNRGIAAAAFCRVAHGCLTGIRRSAINGR